MSKRLTFWLSVLWLAQLTVFVSLKIFFYGPINGYAFDAYSKLLLVVSFFVVIGVALRRLWEGN